MGDAELANFLVVADCGSMTRAAAIIGIAPSSLSEQLLRLEDEVGSLLLLRTPRGVALTPAGAGFVAHAKRILGDMASARAALAGQVHGLAGEVAIGMPNSLNALLGARLLRAAHDAFPAVSLRVMEARSTSLVGQLRGPAAIDFAIVLTDDPFEGHAARIIGREPVLLVGRRDAFGPVDDHGLARSPATLATVEGRDFVLPTAARGAKRVLDRLTGQQRPPIIRYENDGVAAVLALIEATGGYTLMPYAVVREEMAQGRLAATTVDGVDLSRPIAIVRAVRPPASLPSLAIERLTIAVMRDLVDEGAWDARITAAPGAGGEDAALSATG